MNLNRAIAYLGLMIAVIAVGGCLSNRHGDVPEQLTLKVRVFEDVVRWRSLTKMYAFLKPSDESVAMQDGLENVRVTGYEIVEPLNKIDDTHWRQAVLVDYVLTDRQIVRQLVDYQLWETDDQGKTWYRASPVPIFK